MAGVETGLLDLDDGQVRERVGPHDGGRQLLAGGEGDGDGGDVDVGLAHDVIVGHDHAVRRDDHAGTRGAVLLSTQCPTALYRDVDHAGADDRSGLLSRAGQRTVR